MSKKRLLSLVAVPVLLISACGQKGPLYLPQDAAKPAPPSAAPMVTAPAATMSSPAAAVSSPAASANEDKKKAEQKNSTANGGEADIEK